MNAETELEIWREQWQVESPLPIDLRGKVERQGRLMRIGLAGDLLVTIVMGGGSIVLAVRSPESDFALVAVATWLFLAAAWVFVLLGNRGLWVPVALTNRAFLDLSIRRCQRTFRAIVFSVAMFSCEVGFGLWWAYEHSVKSTQSLSTWLMFSSLRIDVVWFCTTVFLAAVIWYWRKKRLELAALLDLQMEMSADVTPSEETLLHAEEEFWRLGRSKRIRRKKKPGEA